MRQIGRYVTFLFDPFQSTHPLRGATDPAADLADEGGISIHAPLAGCDSIGRIKIPMHSNFNPRTPCGVRQEESKPSYDFSKYFNPRTPCGVRQNHRISENGYFGFQSTHPLRGATLCGSSTVLRVTISIHAPLAGCDCVLCATSQHRSYFNPRTPCGVRRVDVTNRKAMTPISIHAPLAGCDINLFRITRISFHFNPRTPCGVRH